MKIGLVGCGRAAELHMRAFKHLDASVVAACDTDSRRTADFARRHNIPKALSNYKDLLQVRDLDFVDICTPPSTHVSLTSAAAESGQNILLEKPMALSVDGCDEIIRQTAKHNVKLCVCHNQIFFPSIKRARSRVVSGEYEIASFRTCVKENPTIIGAPPSSLSDDEKGMIWEAGCHHAYLHLNFLKEISQVYAVGNTVTHPVLDSYAVLLRTTGKAIGIMEMSWLSNTIETEYEIGSADGRRMIIDRYHNTITELPETSRSNLFGELKQALHPIPEGLDYSIGHYFLLREYMRSLREDEAPPVDPSEGRRAIKLLECIDESLKTGRPVQFQ